VILPVELRDTMARIGRNITGLHRSHPSH
jgi:hypothetical protein